MNITICYFARFREKLAIQQESYTLPNSVEIKELKNPSKESLLMAEFEAYKLEFPFSSEEVAVAIKEATLTLKEEHKKEINKLKSELAKKEKELTTLKKQIDKVE